MMAARCDQVNGGRPSVETMLHEQINYKFVVHTHPSLINGLTCGNKGKNLADELFGEDILWVDYCDPEYTLSKRTQSALKRYRKEKDNKEPAIIFIQNHGVFIGADDPETIKKITDGIVAGLKTYMQQTDYKSVFGKPVSSIPENIDEDSHVSILAPALRGVLSDINSDFSNSIVTFN